MKETPTAIFWFRRDLRLNDNAGLYHALKENESVLPIFIFDTDILNQLEDKADARVEFIHQHIQKLQKQLVEFNSSILVSIGNPLEVFKNLINQFKITKVYTNHDYEPYAITRDKEIATLLQIFGASFHTFKDQVIFEKDEVVKDDQKPYTVFTPYMRKWKSNIKSFYTKAYPTQKYFSSLIKTQALTIPTLDEIGFKPSGINFPTMDLNENIVKEYKEQRDIPAISGTSKLSVHLIFGTVSIRQLVVKTQVINET